MGTQLPSPKGAQPPPQFSAHNCCGQMTAWIKMSLGMEVGLGPGDFVLDGDPAPPSPKGGGTPQIFGPCLLWPNGWMDQDGTCHGGRPWSSPHCARWGQSSPPQKRGQSPPPNFRPISLCPNGWLCIKMPLGMEVGLSPGEFVLDGDPASFCKRGQSTLPSFKG